MRILQITASLKIGGQEKVTRDIGMAALKAGHEMHYVVFGDAVGEYEGELVSLGAVIYHIASPSAGYVKYLRTLKQLMLDNQYDVVHAHTMFSIGWAMWIAKECGVPVRIAHAHSALKDGSELKKNVYEQIMRLLILQNATDLVACGNAAGIRLFGERAYRERGICIPNGIDVNAYAFRREVGLRIREENGLQNAFVIGHVGHLANVKNQSFLIRLLPEILQLKPDARLLMLGEGEDRQMLEELVQSLGLTDKVMMTGNVRNVADYLNAMDVFAFPSIYEGMPLTVLEAQANGLPCVLSTGVPDDVYLTDLIETVSLEDPQRWIDAVCMAKRNDPEHYAVKLFSMGFDADTVVNRILQLYERTAFN